jgi:NADH-quinone oxidoreductase subunit M
VSYLLSIITFLPLVGAIPILFLARLNDKKSVARNARWIALIFTVADLILSIVLWAKFDGSSSAFQFVEHHAWLTGGIRCCSSC